MSTIYVSDLDGTLLDAGSRLSAESAAIISDLTARGALITVATARTPATVEPLLAEAPTALPAIVMTGAALWDRHGRRYIDTKLIPADVSATVRDICLRHGVYPFVYTLDRDLMLVYHSGPLSADDRRFIGQRDRLALKRFILDDEAALSRDLPATVLLFAMGSVGRIFPLAEELRAGVDCSVSAYIDIFGDDVGILEVFAPGVSKADAVSRVARRSGADRVVVFGDNLNDLPMMAVADVAVAVDNALPQVKEAADIIIGPNTANSVARFIKQDYDG